MTVQTLAAVLLLYSAPPLSSDSVGDDPSHQAVAPSEIAPAPLMEPISISPPIPKTPTTIEDMATGEQVPVLEAPENEILVTADTEASRVDPLKEVNLISYQAIQSVDQAVVGPVAKGYERAIPEPIRDGLGNALRNISEPINFLNFLLQLKIGKAAETVGRFAVNSTIGIGGILDVAKKKPFKLPYRRNGFANTMGFYGIKPGPYFYLPLIGPTTLRDFAGNGIDLLLLPNVVGKPFDRPAYSIPTNIIMQLNARVERDAEIKRLREESPNPYAETRALYLEMRQNEINALKVKRRKGPTPPATETLNDPFLPETEGVNGTADAPLDAVMPTGETIVVQP